MVPWLSMWRSGLHRSCRFSRATTSKPFLRAGSVARRAWFVSCCTSETSSVLAACLFSGPAFHTEDQWRLVLQVGLYRRHAVVLALHGGSQRECFPELGEESYSSFAEASRIRQKVQIVQQVRIMLERAM